MASICLWESWHTRKTNESKKSTALSNKGTYVAGCSIYFTYGIFILHLPSLKLTVFADTDCREKIVRK